jgi:hypothetical protein
MTDKIKYAGQDEYIVRNYLVNEAVVCRNDTGKLQKPHQKFQKDSEKHLYL